MLKLRKNSFFLLLWIVIASFIMACEQGNDTTSSACEELKEILVSMPLTPEGAEDIDTFEIQVIDPASMEILEQFEALPGESNAASVIDTGEPVLIKATALNALGDIIAQTDLTNLIGLDRDGVLCDFTIDVNRNEGESPSLEISMDCKVIEIMKKVVKFVRENFKKVAKVSIYVVKDTVEDMTEIVKIWREE